MKAIVLAAGSGQRLRPVMAEPKCLLEVCGRTLLERYLNALAACGVREVSIVVGYQRHLIEQALERATFPGQLSVIVNPRYAQGSIVSLHTALEELVGDVLVMDADVYFEEQVLKRLTDSKAGTAMVMDGGYTPTGEEIVALCKDGRVSQMARGLSPPTDEVEDAEWVGFARFDAASSRVLRRELARGIEDLGLQAAYEDVLGRVVTMVDVRAIRVDGLRWVEIDFEDDYRKAEQLAAESELCGRHQLSNDS